MHSNIYQISSNPISEEDYISEDAYFDGFVGEIADYVRETYGEERESNIEWLTSVYPEVFKRDGNKFTILSKEKYFERKYNTFLEEAAKIKNITFSQFSGDESSDLDMIVYRLKSAYEDRFGFYIDGGGEYSGLETFDEFMRRAKNGTVFYVGVVIDYHF